jgi:hypothetical protein
MISVTFNFSEFCISSITECHLLFVRFGRGVVLCFVMSKIRALDN